jgi:hypothetical protein
MQEQEKVLFNAFNNEGVVESLFPVREQVYISRKCTKIRGCGMETPAPSRGKHMFFNVFRCQWWHGGFLLKTSTGFAQRFLPSHAAYKNITHSKNINC